MSISSGQLTVFFEDPFWIGVFEVIENGKLSVCKVTFGAEPKDYEILEFVLKNYYHLKFSPSVDVPVKKEIRNPKRMQRIFIKICFDRYRDKITASLAATAGRTQIRAESSTSRTERSRKAAPV